MNKSKTKIIFIRVLALFAFILLLGNINGQAEATKPEEKKSPPVIKDESWERHQQITGYISFETEYVDNLEVLDNNYGAGIGEAGLLYLVQPLSKLEIKATFVYKPDFDLNFSFVELFGKSFP